MTAPSPGSDRHLAAHEALLQERVREAVDLSEDVWVFGYGSLVWRPDLEYDDSRHCVLQGYVRRFAQASPDHRGRPGAWGRVATLIREEDADEALGPGWRVVDVDDREEEAAASSSSAAASSSPVVVHGTAYRLVPHAARDMLARLCTREKAGYDCHTVTVRGVEGKGEGEGEGM
jgi:glutathione-specific gamma-glutamylcyclotransferase